MGAYPIHVFLEPSATASLMDPGPVALALWAFWAMGPTVRTWMRLVPLPWAAGCPMEIWREAYFCLSSQCAVVTDICFSTNKAPRCVNTNPGFHCLPCPPRYKGSQPFGVGLEDARTEKQEVWLPAALHIQTDSLTGRSRAIETDRPGLHSTRTLDRKEVRFDLTVDNTAPP